MTTIPTISTISELLSLSNSQYRIYDIGRKIDKISKEQFKKIEANQLPYPSPSQGHAFLAISFWQKQSTQPYLWFVKLPLDERGLLNSGAMSHFIAIIIEALGSDLTVDPNEKQEELLKSNPYNFTPAQYKLASLNSKINLELKQAPSSYYQHCLEYLSGALSWQAWNSVGVQGITDFCVRLTENNNEKILINALPHLPEQVLSPLCGALENEKLSVDIITAILQQLELVDSLKNELMQAQLLRALSSCCQHPLVIAFISKLLMTSVESEEILILLAGRCWNVFLDDKLLINYLELLAKKNDQQLFAAIFKDLVAIPAIRPVLFQCMRSQSRSETLANAIGKLFNQA